MQGVTPPRVHQILTALVSAFLSQLHFGPRVYHALRAFWYS